MIVRVERLLFYCCILIGMWTFASVSYGTARASKEDDASYVDDAVERRATTILHPELRENILGQCVGEIDGVQIFESVNSSARSFFLEFLYGSTIILIPENGSVERSVVYYAPIMDVFIHKTVVNNNSEDSISCYLLPGEFLNSETLAEKEKIQLQPTWLTARDPIASLVNVTRERIESFIDLSNKQLNESLAKSDIDVLKFVALNRISSSLRRIADQTNYDWALQLDSLISSPITNKDQLSGLGPTDSGVERFLAFYSGLLIFRDVIVSPSGGGLAIIGSSSQAHTYLVASIVDHKIRQLQIFNLIGES